MSEKPRAQRKRTTGIDGGEGVGVPLGGRDDRPPTGYQHIEEDESEPIIDSDPMVWDEDEESADRRRDPLRR